MLKLELSYITATKIGSKPVCSGHQLSDELSYINELYFGDISDLKKNPPISRPDWPAEDYLLSSNLLLLCPRNGDCFLSLFVTKKNPTQKTTNQTEKSDLNVVRTNVLSPEFFLALPSNVTVVFSS